MIICLRKQVRFSWTPEDSVQLITAASKETKYFQYFLLIIRLYSTFFTVFLHISAYISNT